MTLPGSFNSGTSTASPCGGSKPTTGTSELGAPPAFGAATSTQPTTGTTGGLFGATNTTGGLFGGSTASTSTAGFGASTSVFRFGATQPAAKPTGGTGLFGATTTQTQAPTFGTNTSTFGFGNTTQNLQQSGGLLFGAAKPATTESGAPPASTELNPRTSCTGGTPNNLPPLRFHSVHGERVRVSHDGSMLRRVESACIMYKGFAFSARPVRVNEKVCIHLVEISTSWALIVFGFTNHDPATLTYDLPEDFICEPGNWAKYLNQSFCEKDNTLYYYVNSSGDVHFGVNGEDKGLVLSGVNTRNPLWALVGLHGDCTVQFVDPRAPSQRRHSPLEEDRLVGNMRSLTVEESLPPPRYQNPLVPLSLHRTKGRNVQCVNDTGVAARAYADLCQGYVFTARPMRPGQTIVVQILATEAAYAGSLAIGFTSCDPATLRTCDLPDDAELLLDRSEYWVVRRDAAEGLRRGDELAVTLTLDGEVRVSRNGSTPVTDVHVDHTVRLWAFVDIYGATQKVRMLSTQVVQQQAQTPPQQLRVLSESAGPITAEAGDQNSAKQQSLTLASAHYIEQQFGGLLFGAAKPATTGIGAPPASTEFGAPPASTEFGAPPASTESGAPPASTEFGAPPASTESGAPPASTESGAPPASTESGAPPASTESSAPPASTESGAPPASTEFGAPPASTEFGATPASTESGAPPASTEFGAPPASTESGAPPASTEFGATPASTESGAPPASTEFGAPPASTESGAPPASTESGAPPASTESGAPPASTESGAPPASTESGAPPASTESGAFGSSGVFGAKTQAPTFGTQAPAFGQPATASTSSVFGGGGLGGTGVFATQPSSFSFANNAQSTNTTGLFGANKPAFGAAPTTGGTGLFGATTTQTQAPTFGTNTSTFGFGNTTQNRQQSGGLLFGAAKPATTEFGAPPASTGIGALPASTGIGARPASTGIGAPPASTGIGARPASTVIGAPPASTGIGAAPLGTGIGARPATTVIGAPPASTVIGAPPASPGICAAPASTGISAPPASTGIGARPASTVIDAPPASTGIGAAPASTGIGAPPTSTESGAPPASTESGAPPASTESGAFGSSGVFGAKTQAPTFGTQAPAFGQPATASTSSVFGGGGLGGTGVFATQPSSFSFANNAQSTNTTGLFGANKPAFGAAPTTGGTGLFGATTTQTQAPTFGTNTSTFGFGNTTQNQQQSGGLLFGAAKPATTGIGAPPASTEFGAPPASTEFGAPSASTDFGAPPASTELGAPPASTEFGAPPASTEFGAPPASTEFGAPPASTEFGAPPVSTEFGAPPASTEFGAPPASTEFGAPPATTEFGAPPASTESGAPPASTEFGAPPASTESGAPPASTEFGAPPASTESGAPPASTEFGAPPASTELNPRTSCTGGTPNNLPPLRFHSVHGEYVRVSHDGSMLRRVESTDIICKGVAFSARPVRVNEKVCLRLVEIESWGALIVYGFTNDDPATLAHALPERACPDLTNKPGNWARGIGGRFCEKDNIIYYYVNSSGDVHFGVNGEDKGLSFSGVDTRNPLWAFVEVCGRSIAVQFADPRAPSQRRHSPLEEDRLVGSMRSLTVEESLPPPRYQNPLVPLSLHRTKGRNVQCMNDRGVAARADAETCQGYVFTARPMRPGQTIVVQILATEAAYDGSLAIGLTSCDPATLRPCDLPDDAELLLDRLESWVVRRDSANGLRRGDELAVTLTLDGEVRVSRNGSTPVTVMHVDHTLRLWAFVDIYGATQKVRMLSTQVVQQQAQTPPQQLRVLTESAGPITAEAGGQNSAKQQSLTLASAHYIEQQSGGLLFGAAKPASTEFGAPPASTESGAPPASTESGAPPASTESGAPPASTEFGAPPASTEFGAPPVSTEFGAPPASIESGAPPASTEFGAPPASTEFGAPPASTEFGAPPASTEFGAPPASTESGAAPANTEFGEPPASTEFGAPPASTEYGAPPASTDLTPRISCTGGTPNNLPPLRFHSVHGETVRVSHDGSMVRRVQSESWSYKGVAFSDRPVVVNEKVCLRLVEISNSLRGWGFRFGFTNHDPATLAHALPENPDLLNIPDIWAKMLDPEFDEEDNIVYYYVNSSGDVHFGVNGEDKGLFFSGVDTRNPLWALVDVYGLYTAVQFADPRAPSQRGHSPLEEDRLVGSMRSLTVEESLPPPRYQNPLVPLSLHRTKGRNVQCVNDTGVAARADAEFCQGYVFTARPMRPGQTIVVQILATEAAHDGSLAIGLTSCDPATLRPCDLPDDAELLLDRPEYWVVRRDAANGLQRGDELAVTLTLDGEVRISRNGSTPVTVMHVDHTVRLWAFVDIYGATQKVRMLSTQVVQQQAQTPPQQLRVLSESAGPITAEAGDQNSANQQSLTLASAHYIEQQSGGLLFGAAKPATTESGAPPASTEFGAPPASTEFGAPPASTELTPRTSCTGGTPNNLPPLRFHSVHEDTVGVFHDGSMVRRVESESWSCQGLAFSARPVIVNEKVCLRLVQITNCWYGWGLRFGFTNHDPATLAHVLPKTVNFIEKPGNWAKWLDFEFCKVRNIIYYYVNSSGDVHFGVNGEDKGLFFSGVNTRNPLWALVQVRGLSAAVEFADPRAPSQRRHSPLEEDRLVGSMRSLTVEESLPLPRYQNPLVPLSLHRTKGRNVQCVNDTGVAARADAELCQGYVFTARPMRPGQTIVVQILATEAAYAGSLAIGLTSCDPATLRPCDLPDDADLLLDRSEYWVFRRVSANSLRRGDELAVTLTLDGEVRVSRNGSTPVTVMHVDHTVRLWAFVDIYGATQKVRMLSTQVVQQQAQTPPQQLRVLTESANQPASCNYQPPRPRTDNQCSSTSQNNFDEQATLPNGHTESLRLADRLQNGPSTSCPDLTGTECTICYDNPIDSVLYTCGHMCMCYRCAVQQWYGEGSGQCPLCRAQIKDVIRTYKS